MKAIFLHRESIQKALDFLGRFLPPPSTKVCPVCEAEWIRPGEEMCQGCELDLADLEARRMEGMECPVCLCPDPHGRCSCH